MLKFYFIRHYFSPLETLMRTGKDLEPDPHLWLTDPDLGRPKTCGSYGSGSGSPTLILNELDFFHWFNCSGGAGSGTNWSRHSQRKCFWIYTAFFLYFLCFCSLMLVFLHLQFSSRSTVHSNLHKVTDNFLFVLTVAEFIDLVRELKSALKWG